MILFLSLLACGDGPHGVFTPPLPPAKQPATLVEARAALPHTAFHEEGDAAPPPKPPPATGLELVTYKAPLGENFAYVTPVKKGPKRPAVLWIQGGFSGSIDKSAWEPGPWENDQSAVALRTAGIAEMYASLRGGSGNPGQPECFLGEVDDLLAAAAFLAARPDVDPTRLYIAGHSTGGTLTLLAAESSTMFRAAVAFGPVADVRAYEDCLPHNAPEPEWRARAAWPYLPLLKTPTWVVEGDGGGNKDSAQVLKEHAEGAPLKVVILPGYDHFTVLAPGVDQLAAAILADTGPTASLDLSIEAIVARDAKKP